VVDASREVDLGRLEGVIRREVDVEEEDPTGIRTVIRAHDRCLPVKKVISDRTRTAVCRGVLPQVLQFLVNSLESH
jgi:hypothetical protein